MDFIDSESMAQKISSQSLPKKGGDSAPMWKFKIQQFIWRSYLVAGTPENMKEKMKAWISAVKDLKNRAQKINALVNVAEDIYRADVDYKLALELLSEAEGEAQLIEDKKARLSWLENIANRRKWMK